MEILKAGIEKLSDIQRLNQLLFKYELKWHPDYDVNWPYTDKGTKYFSDRLNGINGIVFAAFENDVVVGYLAGGAIDTYSFRTVGKIAELENMFVLEKFRSKGIGSQLINAFVLWCKEQNVEIIKVDSVFENVTAIEFYKENKFLEHNVQLERVLN